MKTPAIFVGHGSPMTTLEDNIYRQAWENLGKKLTKPKAILIISAHWYADKTAVSDLAQPRQIYDFYGFPEELYALKYNPPGSATLAKEVVKLLSPIIEVKIDNEWGIDHGAWVPLRSFFPQADIPVVQLSIDYTKSPAMHYKIGQALRPLREQGILIIGSGDIVHNLGQIKYDADAEPYPWAKEFEEKILQHINNKEHEILINYDKIDSMTRLAVPTPEHYLPLLYILALRDKEDALEYFTNGISYGSVSMTSFIIN